MPAFRRLCVLTAVVVAFCCPRIAQGQDSEFRSNAAHTGVFSGPGVPEFHKRKWNLHVKAPFVSSPVVSGGTVYIGSGNHLFYALDLATGGEKWLFQTEGRVQGSAAVSNGSVFFGSYDSNFYCLDAATGNLKWKSKTEAERRFAAKHLHGAEPAAEAMPDPFDFFLSSPVVANDIVYFGSGDTNIYALDAATGNLKWKFKTGDVVHASPALANGTLFVGSWDSYFYALDATSGQEKWRFKT